jgi:hypothetical protein
LVVTDKARRLQGRVLQIEKTGEKKKDEEGNEWERCAFTLELVGFSKRTPQEILPEKMRGMRVKLIRWCCFDWHYKLGVRKTLDVDETEAVLGGRPTNTVYW